MGSVDLCGSVQNCPEQSVLLMLIVASLLAYALSASKFREHQLRLRLLMLNSGKELSFEIATLSTTRGTVRDQLRL